MERAEKEKEAAAATLTLFLLSTSLNPHCLLSLMGSYLLVIAGGICVIAGTVYVVRFLKSIAGMVIYGIAGLVLLAIGSYLVLSFYNVTIPDTINNLIDFINGIISSIPSY
jgi:hypothetical protein